MFIKTFFLVLLIALFPLSLLSKTTADCLGAVNWQTKAVRFYVMCNKNDLLMDKDKCAKAMITIKSALKNNDYSYTDHEDDFEDLYSTQKYTGEFAIIVKSSQGQEGIKILVYDPSTNSGGSFVPIADGTDINAILLSFKNEMKKWTDNGGMYKITFNGSVDDFYNVLDKLEQDPCVSKVDIGTSVSTASTYFVRYKKEARNLASAIVNSSVDSKGKFLISTKAIIGRLVQVEPASTK